MFEVLAVPLLHLLIVAMEGVVLKALRRRHESLLEVFKIVLNGEVAVEDRPRGDCWPSSVINAVGDDVGGIGSLLAGDEVVVVHTDLAEWDPCLAPPLLSVWHSLVVQSGGVLEPCEADLRGFKPGGFWDVPTLNIGDGPLVGTLPTFEAAVDGVALD